MRDSLKGFWKVINMYCEGKLCREEVNTLFESVLTFTDDSDDDLVDSALENLNISPDKQEEDKLTIVRHKSSIPGPFTITPSISYGAYATSLGTGTAGSISFYGDHRSTYFPIPSYPYTATATTSCKFVGGYSLEGSAGEGPI